MIINYSWMSGSLDAGLIQIFFVENWVWVVLLIFLADQFSVLFLFISFPNFFQIKIRYKQKILFEMKNYIYIFFFFLKKLNWRYDYFFNSIKLWPFRMKIQIYVQIESHFRPIKSISSAFDLISEDIFGFELGRVKNLNRTHVSFKLQ